MSDLVLLKTFPTQIEADIAKGFLTSRKIKSLTRADNAGGMYVFPGQSGFAEVKLFVNKKDLKIARKLLKDDS